MKRNKKNAGSKLNKTTVKISEATLREVGKKLFLTLRIMDDMLAKQFFKDPRCVEILVNTVLKQQIKVVESLTQYNMNNAQGRSAIVDVLAKTEDGKVIVVEIQRVSDKWLPLRARHICSVSDANLIKSGTKFKDIYEFYTIFIMEKDPFGEGKSIYTVRRTFDETHKLFKDRQTIIFVNGATKEEGELGELLDDFLTRDYRKMKNEVFRETMRLIKASAEREDKGMMKFITKEMKELAKQLKEQGKEEGIEKGIAEGIEKGIAEGIEKGRLEGRQEGRLEGRLEGRQEGFLQSAMNLLKMGFSVEDVARGTGLSREKVSELKVSI